MRSLLFISRVAFITNIFFILCLIIRHTDINIPKASHEFILIVGWILSRCLNVIWGTAIVVMSLRKKLQGMPLWVNVFNAICLFGQICYFFLL